MLVLFKMLGILLTGVVLIEEMCQVNPDSLVHFKRVSIASKVVGLVTF